MELAVETPVVRKTATVQVRPEDKVLFDALQAWYLFTAGKRLTQWELFTLVLVDALENQAGRFAGARDIL